MQPIAIPPQIVGGIHETRNTEEAATLRALKIPTIATRTDHDAQHPYDSGRGFTVFSMEPTSSEWKTYTATGDPKPLGALQVARAFHGDGHQCAEMDDLIDSIEAADTPQKRQEVANDIRNALPLVVACFARAVFEQKQQCMALIRTSPHHANGRSRDGRHYSVDVRNHKFARRHQL